MVPGENPALGSSAAQDQAKSEVWSSEGISEKGIVKGSFREVEATAEGAVDFVVPNTGSFWSLKQQGVQNQSLQGVSKTLSPSHLCQK